MAIRTAITPYGVSSSPFYLTLPAPASLSLAPIIRRGNQRRGTSIRTGITVEDKRTGKWRATVSGMDRKQDHIFHWQGWISDEDATTHVAVSQERRRGEEETAAAGNCSLQQQPPSGFARVSTVLRGAAEAHDSASSPGLSCPHGSEERLPGRQNLRLCALWSVHGADHQARRVPRVHCINQS